MLEKDSDMYNEMRFTLNIFILIYEILKEDEDDSVMLISIKKLKLIIDQ